MRAIKFMMACIAIGLALSGQCAHAAEVTRSKQEIRNVDNAVRMHGLLEADHGRIYGWGERDDYKNIKPSDAENTTEMPQEWHPQAHRSSRDNADEDGQ